MYIFLFFTIIFNSTISYASSFIPTKNTTKSNNNLNNIIPMTVPHDISFNKDTAVFNNKDTFKFVSSFLTTHILSHEEKNNFITTYEATYHMFVDKVDKMYNLNKIRKKNYYINGMSYSAQKADFKAYCNSCYKKNAKQDELKVTVETKEPAIKESKKKH